MDEPEGSKKTRWGTIATVIAIAVLVIGAYAGYSRISAARNQKIVNSFGQQHDQVMKDYVYDVIGFGPATLAPGAIATCSEHDQYVAYMNMDETRMTIPQLKDALSLFDACHNDFTSGQYLLDNNLSTDVSNLIGIAATIGNPTVAALANQIGDKWRQIEIARSERTDIVNQAFVRQQQYWDTELQYDQVSMGITQRNSEYATLNDAAQAGDTKADDLLAQAKQIFTDEQDLWSVFKAKTGYVEASSSSSTK